MATTNFYAPPSAIKGSRVVFPEDERHHLRSVLRAQERDEVVVVDGEGGWHRVRIDHLASNQVVGTIQESRQNVGEPDVHVTVGMGLLTKRSRFETFVEKAVEVGVARIVPLRTRHAETGTLRRERIRNVMIAALKQCRRSRLPALAEPQPVERALSTTEVDLRVLCHGGDDRRSFFDVVGGTEPGARVLLMVGPEGGFSSEEVEQAEAAGSIVASLGSRRLRAETAGLVALSAVTLSGEGPSGTGESTCEKPAEGEHAGGVSVDDDG
jgi:16S rRNA (uracil1498-N3)-methyltransferase